MSDLICVIKAVNDRLTMVEAEKMALEEKLRECEVIIERGDAIKNNWENNCYQEATHYSWLDDQNDKLEQKIAIAIGALSQLTGDDFEVENHIQDIAREALAKIKAPSDPVKKAIDDFCDKKGW